MAPGATTHGFDTNQRYVDLKVLDKVGGQGVDVVAPPSANVAPPGYYMLFLINDAGVPSVASWVRIDPSAPDRPTIGAPPTGDFNGDGFPDLRHRCAGRGRRVGDRRRRRQRDLRLRRRTHRDRQPALTQNDVGAGETAASGNRFGAARRRRQTSTTTASRISRSVPPARTPDRRTTLAPSTSSTARRTGCRRAVSQVLSQGGGGIQGSPAAGDRFGAALAAGDLNGDGRDDLAVGAPGDGVGSRCRRRRGQRDLRLRRRADLDRQPALDQNSTGIARRGRDRRLVRLRARGRRPQRRRPRRPRGRGARRRGRNDRRRRRQRPLRLRRGLTSTGNQLWSQNSTGIADGRRGRRLVRCRARGRRPQRRRPRRPRGRGPVRDDRDDVRPAPST